MYVKTNKQDGLLTTLWHDLVCVDVCDGSGGKICDAIEYRVFTKNFKSQTTRLTLQYLSGIPEVYATKMYAST
jgi:hypothetical protein